MTCAVTRYLSVGVQEHFMHPSQNIILDSERSDECI